MVGPRQTLWIHLVKILNKRVREPSAAPNQEHQHEYGIDAVARANVTGERTGENRGKYLQAKQQAEYDQQQQQHQ